MFFPKPSIFTFPNFLMEVFLVTASMTVCLIWLNIGEETKNWLSLKKLPKETIFLQQFYHIGNFFKLFERIPLIKMPIEALHKFCKMHKQYGASR